MVDSAPIERGTPHVKYKIGTAAKLTGLSPFLLRAWENRYDLLSPSRTDTGRRFYTDGDVELLKAVKVLLDRDFSIGEVASWGRTKILNEARTDQAHAEAAVTTDALAPSEASGGFEPLFAATRTRLLDAAIRFDRDAIDAALAEVSASAPFDAVIDEVLIPVLHEAGMRWACGKITIATEHFLTAAIRQRISTMIQATSRSSGPLALVASAPGDYHEIGGLIACYKLARMGWAVTYLGANLPILDFADAVAQMQPGLVALSLTLHVPAELLQTWMAEILDVAPPDARLLIGGAGARCHAELLHSEGFELDFEGEVSAIVARRTSDDPTSRVGES